MIETMKATELRVNNWYNSTKFQIPIMCEFADFAELDARADGAKVDEDLIDEMFQSILLTEEWLLKFGFKKKVMYSWNGNGADWQPKTNKTECTDFVLNDSFFVRFHNWGYIPKGKKEFEMDLSFLIFRSEWYEKNTEYEVNYNECDYVHQLQNLYFALTGNELEIK